MDLGGGGLVGGLTGGEVGVEVVEGRREGRVAGRWVEEEGEGLEVVDTSVVFGSMRCCAVRCGAVTLRRGTAKLYC